MINPFIFLAGGQVLVEISIDEVGIICVLPVFVHS